MHPIGGAPGGPAENREDEQHDQTEKPKNAHDTPKPIAGTDAEVSCDHRLSTYDFVRHYKLDQSVTRHSHIALPIIVNSIEVTRMVPFSDLRLVT